MLAAGCTENNEPGGGARSDTVRFNASITQTPWTINHHHGSGTATEYSVIGSATFTDGTAGQLYGRKIDEDPSGDTYEMVFNGGGSKTVYSVTIGSKTHLIGRRAYEIFTLKVDLDGTVILRDPDPVTQKIPIGTYVELNLVRDDLAGDYIQEADIDLMGGVVGGAPNCTPIGTFSDRFTGSYDGGGHTIANLVIDSPGANDVGLFGCVDGTGGNGNLTRIGIVSGAVTGNRYVGGVCGSNFSGTITECYNNATVTGTSYVGGVCGWNNTGSITACYNTGEVSAQGDYVGGVCGTSGFGGTITACYNTGEFETDGTYINVGGVCGWNNTGSITACYFLKNGDQPGVGTDDNDDAETTAFGDGVWPDGSGDWALNTATPGNPPTGYWKDLGSWDPGTGTTGITGAASTFPKLWWEQ